MTEASYVQNLFDNLASDYDKLNQVISGGLHWGWKKTAVQALQLKPGHHALDVCTGTGDNLKLLRKKVGLSGRVTGLDFSENMLAMASQRFGTNSNIQLIQADALALPFEQNQFDGALITFGLRNVVDRSKCISEMARVVKTGGWVVNLDTAPDPWLPGFNTYFQWVMPKLGRLLAQNEQAYTYLAKSTAQFIAPSQLVSLFEQVGLQSVYARRMAFGSVALIAGQVP